MTTDVQEGIVEMKSISPHAAFRMIGIALDFAKQRGVKKMMVGVMGMERFLLASASCGGVTLNNELAMRNKLETVLYTQRSTHIQRAYMQEKGINPANYGEAIKTLFSGGLVVYADPNCTQIVGAIAASGGSGSEDAWCCFQAVYNVGLYTDEIDSIDD